MKLDPQILLARCREERAASVRPGSEQEQAWHAIVPNPEYRRPVQTPALPSPSSTQTNNTEANPS